MSKLPGRKAKYFLLIDGLYGLLEDYKYNYTNGRGKSYSISESRPCNPELTRRKICLKFLFEISVTDRQGPKLGSITYETKQGGLIGLASSGGRSYTGV